jgi:hypothetical protein
MLRDLEQYYLPAFKAGELTWKPTRVSCVPHVPCVPQVPQMPRVSCVWTNI